MPLQSGEVFIGTWEPYIVEPRYFNYIDYLKQSSTGVTYSIITEEITLQNAEFNTGYHVEPNPFSGQYDRFEYDEVLYQRSTAYLFEFSRENGTSSVGLVEGYSYSKTPNTIPEPLPYPTFWTDVRIAGLLHDNSNRPVSRITSINWVPRSTEIVWQEYAPQLYLPGWYDPPSSVGFTTRTFVTSKVDSAAIAEPGFAFAYPDAVGMTPTRISFYKRASKPTYYDLLRGYRLDDRIIPNSPGIIVSEKKSVTIGYYRENKLEPIPELRSIDWLTYKCDIPADTYYVLPIVDCVLGTLDISDLDIANEINLLATPSGKYPFKYYFGSNLAELFAGWYALWNPNNTVQSLDAGGNGILETRILRKLGANNNHWNNRPSETPDLNVEPTHPMFMIDTARSFGWHLSPQSEGIGTLIMDSIRDIESHAYLLELRQALQSQNYQVEDLTSDPPVHYLDWYIKNSGGEKLEKVYKALGAELWGTNPDSPDVARVDNLGWRIRRLCEVLGIRVKTDGTIDEALEKTTNRRLHSSGDTENNIQEYNPNCFGTKGMLVRVLPNKFNSKGTVSGGYSKIIDIPQFLAEMHEQANAAMGYQEGTAIEINIDGKTYRYPNQLALLTELLITAKQTATYSKGAFFSSLVSEQSIKEVMGGLGLRTVDKFLEFNVAGKTAKLYYKGISASQSVRRKLSAVATNVGIAIGNII